MWRSLIARRFSAAVAKINAYLASFAESHSSRKHVRFLDCGAHFLAEDASRLDDELLPDGVQPNAAGLYPRLPLSQVCLL